MRASLLAPVEPLHPYGRSQFLHAAGETPSAVVALDGGFARVGPHEHLGHQPLGNLHRFARIDRVRHVDQAVGIDRIAERTEVIIARIGRVGVVGPAEDALGQPVVNRQTIAVEQPLRTVGRP